jgi:hypothetical protein
MPKQKPDNPIFVSKAEERRYHASKKKLAEQKKNHPKCLDPRCGRCYPENDPYKGEKALLEAIIGSAKPKLDS